MPHARSLLRSTGLPHRAFPCQRASATLQPRSSAASQRAQVASCSAEYVQLCTCQRSSVLAAPPAMSPSSAQQRLRLTMLGPVTNASMSTTQPPTTQRIEILPSSSYRRAGGALSVAPRNQHTRNAQTLRRERLSGSTKGNGKNKSMFIQLNVCAVHQSG